MYKGYKRDIAIDGSFASYEFILEGLLRLQIGFDKGKIETGVLLLNSLRSEKSSYGSSVVLAKSEVEMLHPTISLPVSIALFDLGRPVIPDENGSEGSDQSVSAENQIETKTSSVAPDSN